MKCFTMKKNCTSQKKILETHQKFLQKHPGINATWKIINKNYYFPKMRKKIRKIMMNFNECNQNKILRKKPRKLPQPLEMTEKNMGHNNNGF